MKGISEEGASDGTALRPGAGRYADGGVLKNLRGLLQKQAVCCVLTAERRKIINVH